MTHRDRATGEQRITLELDGRKVPLHVRRSMRARRYTLRLDAPGGRFLLIVPSFANLDAGLLFARANEGWMRQRLPRLLPRVPFTEGAEIPFRGVVHVVRCAGSRRGPVSTSRQAGDTRPSIMVGGGPDHMARRLRDWLTARAREDLAAAVAPYADLLGVHVRRICVRDQTSRWGSCSASGTLSFSWRLVMAPPKVLDYLAAHEVAHLREMNHGARFWALVREVAPHTDEAERWLKRHGSGLHRYGQAAVPEDAPISYRTGA